MLRLVGDAHAEEEELAACVQAEISDMDAGRYTVVATPDDSQRLYERMMARLQARLADEG